MAFQIKGALKATQLRGKKVAHVKGRQRINWFANELDSFNNSVEQSRSVISDEQYNILLMSIDGNTNKISQRDLEDRKEKYAIGVDKKQKVMESEQRPSAPDCTAEMGGGIKIGELTVDQGEAIKAEIDFRAIKYSKQYSRLSH